LEAHAAMSDRLSGTMAVHRAPPLDGRFADRAKTTRRPAAHFAPFRRVDRPVAQGLEYGLPSPAGLPPSNRSNQNLADIAEAESSAMPDARGRGGDRRPTGTIAVNRDYTSGIASSLRVGLKATPAVEFRVRQRERAAGCRRIFW
jgi:hypothetical protein